MYLWPFTDSEKLKIIQEAEWVNSSSAGGKYVTFSNRKNALWIHKSEVTVCMGVISWEEIFIVYLVINIYNVHINIY
jgi:hypothetical protein